jgi:hypothetical protein
MVGRGTAAGTAIGDGKACGPVKNCGGVPRNMGLLAPNVGGTPGLPAPMGEERAAKAALNAAVNTWFANAWFPANWPCRGIVVSSRPATRASTARKSYVDTVCISTHLAVRGKRTGVLEVRDGLVWPSERDWS